MEEFIIKGLIEDFAIMIGLELEGDDLHTIYKIYETQKWLRPDVQTILLDALYSLQEERVESQVLLLN